jgi:hypothetical protein
MDSKAYRCVGVVRAEHFLTAGPPPEHGLAKLRDQGVAAILARPGIRKDFSGQAVTAAKPVAIRRACTDFGRVGAGTG